MVRQRETCRGGGLVRILAHKIALDRNDGQETCFCKAAEKTDPTAPKRSDPVLPRERNAVKGDPFPWMLEVNRNAPKMALMHLRHACKNFIAVTAEDPTFKKQDLQGCFTVKGRKGHISRLG